MLINFLGCPSSGKTTCAAALFARLKESGISSEFVAERARRYIAEQKRQNGWTGVVTLNDEHQQEIMQQQMYDEWLMHRSVNGESIVISDSSPLNSLLYMQDVDQKTLDLATRAVNLTDLTFYCYPIEFGATVDPNRIHSENESSQIDQKIPELIAKLFPDFWSKKVIHLGGHASVRFSTALYATLDYRLLR